MGNIVVQYYELLYLILSFVKLINFKDADPLYAASSHSPAFEYDFPNTFQSTFILDSARFFGSIHSFAFASRLLANEKN